MTDKLRPPLGAVVRGDVKVKETKRYGTRYLARARWTHPVTHHREETTETFGSLDAAEEWIREQQAVAKTGIDPGQTLATYIESIGDRWASPIDRTSTYDPYSAGLRLRVIPELGHIALGMISTGLIDRAIDRWEQEYSASTLKNTVAGLVLVLDQAVRDGLIPRNPAKDRARRKKVERNEATEEINPRDLALPDVKTLDKLVENVVKAGGHQCWGDMVMMLACTAMRISEVSGLTVSNVDLDAGLIYVRWQTYPGRGGLVTKKTKGRRKREVPIIEPLRPTLERLTAGRKPDDRLITGPRGGAITTATLRRATGWDKLVAKLKLDGLVRHGLRHTALTWMADSGIDLHMLQRVAGHQDPAVTARYLHPDTEALIAAGSAFSVWWGLNGDQKPQTATDDNAASGE